jgi:hypothetical protein
MGGLQMRSVMAGFGLAAVILVAGCATPKPAQLAAASPPPTSATATAASTQDPDKPICKKVMTTGSRLPTTECHTPQEWGIINKEGEDALQQDTTRQMPSRGGN